VRVNVAANSIVVRYDPKTSSMNGVQPTRRPAAPEEAVSIVEVEETDHSAVAHGLEQFFRNLDHSIGKATGGILNLRAVVPLTLFAMGVNAIIIQEDWAAVPAHSLLWYSYSTFHNMHVTHQKRTTVVRSHET